MTCCDGTRSWPCEPSRGDDEVLRALAAAACAIKDIRVAHQAFLSMVDLLRLPYGPEAPIHVIGDLVTEDQHEHGIPSCPRPKLAR
jgi:hypothetical protein